MAFFGHRRSLQLRSQEDEPPATTSGTPFRESRDRPDIQRQSSGDNFRPIFDQGSTQPAYVKLNASRPDKLITDNKGNPPSRSLWVGNTPLGIDEGSIRSIFERFGRISHVRLPRNLRYVFVNYENVRDAVYAWEECHDKDLFDCESRVNIRFTSSEGEAKEAKRAQYVRKTSIGGSSCVSDNSRPAIRLQDEALASSPQWPNGRPPAGPRLSMSDNRSRPRDLSPPPLRRVGSYRGANRDSFTEHSYTRSAGQDDRRQLLVDTTRQYRPGYDYTRKSSLQYASSVSTSESSLHLDGRRGSTDIAGKDNTGRPRSLADMHAFPNRDAATITSSSNADGYGGANPSASDHTTMHFKQSHGAECTNGSSGSISDPHINNAGSPQNLQDTVPVISASPVGYHDMAQSSTHPLLNKLLDEDRSASAVAFSVKSRTNSPLCRVRKSMERAELNVARAVSVGSEATTSSKSSLSRKKRCSGCNTLESSLMPLTSCSTCPRRFHSGCGEPRPSLCSDDARFVCGKCLKKQKKLSHSQFDNVEDSRSTQPHYEGLGLDLAPETQLDKADSQNHKETRGDDMSIEREKKSRFTSREDDSYSPALPPDTNVNHTPSQSDTRQPGPPNEGLPPQSVAAEYSGPPAASCTNNSWRRIQDRSVAKTYKETVTCPYWRRNDCKRPESDCMFAHRDTGIYSPSGTNVAKEWTCPSYFTRFGCVYGEDCLYAHADTGYYIGIDGKARKKHLTCHWWRRNGHCRKAEEDCLYSHYDTGFYAEDPGTRTMSGSQSLNTSGAGLSTIRQRAPSVVGNTTRRNDPPLSQESIPTSPLTTHHAGADANATARSSKFGDSTKQLHQSTSQNSHETELPSKTQSALHNNGDKASQENGNMARSTIFGLDPRRAKTMATASDPSATKTGQNDEAHESASSLDEAAKPTSSMITSEPDINTSAKSKNSVKPCRICAKNVFSGDVCSKCKLDERPTSASDASMLPPEPSPISEFDMPDDPPNLPESMDVILEQELPSHEAESIAHENSRKLKRVLSGNDMFLPNKRSKPSAVTPVARPFVAHIEPLPTTSTHDFDDSEPHANTSTSLPNGAATTIEPETADCAEEESDEEPLALVRRKVPRKADGEGRDPNSYHQSLPEQPIKAPGPRKLRLRVVVPRRSEVIPDSDEHTTGVESLGGSSNVHETEFQNSPMHEDSENELHPDVIRFVRQHTHEFLNEPEDVEETASLTNTGDKELNPEHLPCKDCSMNHVYCTHRGFIHPMMKQDCLQAAAAAGAVCDACRSRHKRCLHGPDHSVDGKKCLQWLIERKQRQSTHSDGRTKHERDMIEKAATLYEYGYTTDNETQSRSTTTVDEVFDEMIPHRASPYISSPSQFTSEDDYFESTNKEDATNSKAVQDQNSTLERPSDVSPEQNRPGSDVPVPLVRDGAFEGLSNSHSATCRAAGNQFDPTWRSLREKRQLNSRDARLRITEGKKKQSYEILKAQGVVFEAESGGEDGDPIPSFDNRLCPPEPQKESSDPLHHNSRKAVSTNLFDVIGRKKPDTTFIAPKITKGEGLKGRFIRDALGTPLYTSGPKLVRQRAMSRNLQLHGNAHYEVDRNHAESTVTALVEKKISSNVAGDRFTPPVVEIKEQTMTFKEFLGIGLGEGTIEPCVIGVGLSGAKTLAFREAAKVEKGLGIFSRKRRTVESGTWPVREV